MLSLHAVVRHLFHYPETLGLIMAVQLLIGRYTGYRLTRAVPLPRLLKVKEEQPETAAAAQAQIDWARWHADDEDPWERKQVTENNDAA